MVVFSLWQVLKRDKTAAQRQLGERSEKRETALQASRSSFPCTAQEKNIHKGGSQGRRDVFLVCF